MPEPSRPWRATQPLKALCIACFYLSTPPYLVYLILKCALLRRESPRLSLKANVSNPVVRALFNIITRTRSPRLLAEALPKDRARVTPVPAAPASLFAGVLTSNPAVKPAARTALWFPKAPADGADLAAETVVLHLPGGAFVMEVGHEAFGRKAADVVLHGAPAGARFVWAQYRLASTPGQAFPAAVQDALTFYAHLLSLGYDPKNVVLSGDSAGGNNALALLRYLEETKALPLPRGVMAWSPWVEVTPRAGRDFAAAGAVATTDILTPEFLQWGADAYLPRGGALTDEVAGYVSPLHRPFRTRVPLFLHAGEAEGFCATVREFAAEMEALNGGDRVRFHGTPHAVHDLVLVWEGQDMRKEAEAAVRDAWETVGA